MSDVAAIIPAHNEERRIEATVCALRNVDGVAHVIVVDDGSSDATSRRASAAGAIVVTHVVNRGKGAAMDTGAVVAAALDQADGRPSRHLLFVDADLEASASATARLIEPVRAGDADMSIALLPRRPSPDAGGHGMVVRLARWGIKTATRWEPRQPLSGQRCLTRDAFEMARPLGERFRVETALTIDLLRRGLRVVEIEIDAHHRVTGRDLASQWHRARQLIDVALALIIRLARSPASSGRKTATVVS
jgi:glycosyltransferase involved in cell wall biosynthesis